MKSRYNQNKLLRFYNFIPFLFFFFLFVLSFFYAHERIINSDPSYYFFNIINDKTFFIPHRRYTTVFNQFLLVAGIKFNLSLPTLLYIYSASFVLTKFIYFYIANNLLKCRTAGYTIIVFSIIGIAESYFRPTSESTLALLNSTLLYALLVYFNRKEIVKFSKSIIFLLLSILFAVIGYFTHPIALFSLLFIIIYFSVANKKLTSFFPYVAISVTIFIFIIDVFFNKKIPSHETSVYQTILHSPLLSIKFEDFYPYKFFKRSFSSVFNTYIFLLIISIAVGLIKKRWKITVFLIVYSLSYFVFACISYKNGDSNMQMEKIFLPLTMFAGVFFFDRISLYKPNIWGYLIFILIGFIGLKNIHQAGKIYGSRLSSIKKELIIKKVNSSCKKYVISEELTKKYNIYTNWTLGIETLILSSLDKDIEPITVYQIHDKNLDIINSEKINKNDAFIAAPFYKTYGYNKLNRNYFNLPLQKYCTFEDN